MGDASRGWVAGMPSQIAARVPELPREHWRRRCSTSIRTVKESVMTFRQIADREIHERHVGVLYNVALLLAVALIVLAVIAAM